MGGPSGKNQPRTPASHYFGFSRSKGLQLKAEPALATLFGNTKETEF